mgnify:CR=1 FL=1
MGHNEYSRAEPWAIAAVRVTAAIESVVGRATREEDSFGSYRNELKKGSSHVAVRRTGEGAIDGIVGIGVLAALEKGELTCEAVRKALVGYRYGSLAL